MEYRLVRHAVTEETRVIGGDGLVSPPLIVADYLTEEGELRPGWWRADRDDYCTALWQHPLWRVLARHDPDAGGWWKPQVADDAGFAFAGEPGRGGSAPAPGASPESPRADPPQEAE